MAPTSEHIALLKELVDMERSGGDAAEYVFSGIDGFSDRKLELLADLAELDMLDAEFDGGQLVSVSGMTSYGRCYFELEKQRRIDSRREWRGKLAIAAVSALVGSVSCQAFQLAVGLIGL